MRNVRQDRLNAYAKMSGPRGASRDQDNIDYWSKRAETNSEIAPRAAGKTSTNGAREPNLDLPRLPSTKQVTLRDTAQKPYASRNVDTHMAAKQDLNFVGSSPYMRCVRRTEA